MTTKGDNPAPAPRSELYAFLAQAVFRLRGTLLYTAAVAAIAAAIGLTLLVWAPSAGDVRVLVARMVMLALVGAGMAIATRRLLIEQADAQAVRGAAERLQALDRFRAEFITNVSHELRTPLTAARAGLGILQTSAVARLRADEAELLGNARRNIERLNVLIDDLLAHNQIEVGTLRLDCERLDLRAVVMRAVSAVHSLLQEKGQRLELELPEPLLMAGDGGRLEQMVINLLSNAHRHTPSGTHIMITGQAVDGEIHLCVGDNGPGIPAAELDGIFQRFHHLSSADSSSGLGLAIARTIVELHQGRVWAESRRETGVDFCVALPGLPNGDQR